MTVLQAMEIYKKLKIKQVDIYSSGFNGGRMRRKGYQATQIYFLKETRNCVEEKNLDGYVEDMCLGMCMLFPSYVRQ